MMTKIRNVHCVATLVAAGTGVPLTTLAAKAAVVPRAKTGAGRGVAGSTAAAVAAAAATEPDDDRWVGAVVGRTGLTSVVARGGCTASR
jgi:hypothetical protein